jgi:hypothetical protein
MSALALNAKFVTKTKSFVRVRAQFYPPIYEMKQHKLEPYKSLTKAQTRASPISSVVCILSETPMLARCTKCLVWLVTHDLTNFRKLYALVAPYFLKKKVWSGLFSVLPESVLYILKRA